MKSSAALAFQKYYETPPDKAKVLPPVAVKGTQVKILGCGTSAGVPLLACHCSTCRSKDPRNTRSRASIIVQSGRTVFLIDTTPDLRMQCLTHKVFWVDAVLFTHPHADHIHGIDDLRCFNFIMAQSIPCFGNDWTLKTLQSRFDYIFKHTEKAGGKPIIDLKPIKKSQKIQGVCVQPLELIHGKMPVLGYRMNDVAYITDCSYIPGPTLKHLKNLDVLILDCLRPKEHPTHLNVKDSIALAKKIGAKRTYFTHMGHELEYSTFAKSLPRGMYPAYDGLLIRSS